MGNDCQPGCECKTGNFVGLLGAVRREMVPNLKCHRCGADTGSPYAGICCTCDSIRRARLACATAGCTNLRRDGGKSKYCPACGKVARANWRDMVANKAAERDARDDQFAAAWADAQKAARAAAEAATPAPMVVGDADLMGNPVPGGRRYVVEGGPCGFAWVKVRPANSAFANWAKRTGVAKGGRSYGGGLTVAWCPAGGTQSMARQEAAADAMAEVLRDTLGVDARSESRMD